MKNPDSIAIDQSAILRHTWADERETLKQLVHLADLGPQDRARICEQAAQLVQQIRQESSPSLMEVFLAEYGLSTNEGVALMCLAEALLRVPDAETIDALIEDKIAPSNWSRHIGHSSSPLVNASTWALMFTGKVLQPDAPGQADGPAGHLHTAIRRLGEPVIRTAVSHAMKEMGKQFVLGETIADALVRASHLEQQGYCYSYDMLGEAALTEADAERYHQAYTNAIAAIAGACQQAEVSGNPGISVKLSALHPRYEMPQKHRVMDELVPRLRSLAQAASAAGMGLNVDAEEAARLCLSLDVIKAALSDPGLAGWDGFGVVVQAYGQRAAPVIDYLHDLARQLDRRLMVRLVKGAYWDTEIKLAQVAGIEGFPVFTTKSATDVSYIANARKLLTMTDHLYPQFATHNAQTAAAVLHMARQQKLGKDDFEFQRLHGMGEALHEILMKEEQTRCRIYAPVGAHRDLLAYLVRRLLENGANSSFVHQLVNEEVSPEELTADPFEVIANSGSQSENEAGGQGLSQEAAMPGAAVEVDQGHSVASDLADASNSGSQPDSPIKQPADLFAPARKNSRGYDLTHQPTLDAIDAARQPYAQQQWTAVPILAGAAQDVQAPVAVTKPADTNDQQGTVNIAGLVQDVQAPLAVTNPADLDDQVGTVIEANDQQIDLALQAADPWSAPAIERARVLLQVAELYESKLGEWLALLCREAGKTLKDAVDEVREAVDFLRYYAACLDGGLAAGSSSIQNRSHHLGGDSVEKAEVRSGQFGQYQQGGEPLGNLLCISPWNFPLAIFTGQVSAALAAGNAVLAKPAEQTPLIACLAVQTMHEAGVPRHCLQCLPGDGEVGARLVADPRIDGVAFTGSTQTARTIHATLAARSVMESPLKESTLEEKPLTRTPLADKPLTESPLADEPLTASPGTTLIAETGGLNAMIVDSTALPEQAVTAIIESAFLSAGQRCSALRCLYVHKDLAETLTTMLTGAMDQLTQGNPWNLATDLGPVIDAEARAGIAEYIDKARTQGRVIHESASPVQAANPGQESRGHFITPCLIRVNSIADLPGEIFGPVLHLATFEDKDLSQLITEINATGYGLTFGLMTRIDDRVQQATEQVRAGNIYVNRNQVGAVVGSQPFGGEGLSGTGPKAGGPHYLTRFRRHPAPSLPGEWPADDDLAHLQARLDESSNNQASRSDHDTTIQSAHHSETAHAELLMPGPTGESNKLSLHPRDPLLCLGPGMETAQAQAEAVRNLGGRAVAAEGRVSPDKLLDLQGYSGLLWWGDAETGQGYAKILAARPSPILPLITGMPDICHAFLERHVCVNTTAAGGNAELLMPVTPSNI